MKSIEQIAAEAAEAFVPPPESDGGSLCLSVGGVLKMTATKGESLESLRGLYLDAVRGCVLGAFREALALDDQPVPAERLERIWEGMRRVPPAAVEVRSTDRAVMAHVEFLERRCALLMREPEGAAFAAGYEAGLERARRAAGRGGDA